MDGNSPMNDKPEIIGGTAPTPSVQGTFGNGQAPLSTNTSLQGDGYSSEQSNSANIPPAVVPTH